MGVLQFDGTDDRLKWTTLASPLSNASNGAWTIAALVKRGHVNPAGEWDAICFLLSGTGSGTAEAGLSFDEDDYLSVDLHATDALSSPTTFTNTTSPYMLVVSKGAGTVAPRLAWKLGSAGSWTHLNMTQTVPDGLAATMMEIGAWLTGDPFQGHIGVIAWWEGAMSDANKEALDNNWRTSDWYNSAHGTPVFLAELNVAGASVVDLIGNATSLSATGTTLDGGETLDSWNFDGTGAAGRTKLNTRSNPLGMEIGMGWRMNL